MSARRLLAALGAFAFAGCSSTSPPAAADAGPSWQVVLQHLDGALLSVWGTSPTDVYAVGGPHGNTPFKALVMHFDGSRWTRLDAGNTDTYWWVHGSGPGDVWMTGENGRISRYNGAGFTHHPSGTSATIFGVWAASPGDAWAVGGTPEGAPGAPNDVVLHWDGASWRPSPLPQTLGRAYYKVWGSGPDDVYIVGEAGTIWHRTGGAWTLESDPPLAHGTLLTVHGCGAGDVWAVGSRDVLHRTAGAWRREPVAVMNDVNGVSCGAADVLVVGFGGLKQRLEGGAWQDDFGTQPYADLHGAWVDPSGGLWAAGGAFLGAPAPGLTREGVLAHYGRSPVSSVLAP